VIVVEPTELPVTTPLLETIDAIEPLLLLQVPGEEKSVIVITESEQMDAGPPSIGAGSAFTVIGFVM